MMTDLRQKKGFSNGTHFCTHGNELLFTGSPHDHNAAQREMERTVANSHQPLDNKAYLQAYVVPTLLKGLSEMYEVRPQSPIEWLADWLEENNPNRS